LVRLAIGTVSLFRLSETPCDGMSSAELPTDGHTSCVTVPGLARIGANVDVAVDSR
jgi:hypothetical protein